MRTARIKIKPSSMVFYVASAVSSLTAASLTVFISLSHDESVFPLFYPLLPGLIAGLLITGGHGGTDVEEKVAVVIAAIVNAVAYLLVVVIIRFLWRLCFRDNARVATPRKETP